MLPAKYVELAPARKHLYNLFEGFTINTPRMSLIALPCVHLYPGHEPTFPQAWVPGSSACWVEYLELHHPRGVFEFLEHMKPFHVVYFKPASDDSRLRILTHTKYLDFKMKNGVASVAHPARALKRLRPQARPETRR